MPILERIIKKLRERGYTGRIEQIPALGNSATACLKIEKDGHWHFVKVYASYDEGEVENFRRRINDFMELSLNPKNYIVRISEKVTEPERDKRVIYPFIVEDCGKCNLEDLISSEPENVKRDAVKIATQLATALNACAKKGWVHRDVKPSNIIVFDDGYRLGDFNTLKSISGMSRGSFGTLSFGTNGYIAPEVEMSPTVPRNPHTEARDVYSTGLNLFQCVTATVYDDLFPKITVKTQSGDKQESDCAKYMELQKKPEEFYKHLGLDQKVSNPIIRAIIKKCLAYDDSKYKEWRKMFDAGEEVDPNETPWRKRYQTHEKVLTDLKVAAYHSEFDDISSMLALSARENSGKLAESIAGETKKEENLADKLKRVEGNLSKEGISTNGNRNWLLKEFDSQVINKRFKEHSAEIRQAYDSYKAQEDSDNPVNGDDREEIGIHLGNMASVLESYGKILRGESKEGKKAREGLAKEIRILETMYNPDKRIKSFKDKEITDESIAESVIMECDAYVGSHSNSKNPATRENVEYARIKKEEVEATLKAVRDKCDELRQEYIDSVKADADNKTVETGLNDVMDKFKEFGHGKFHEAMVVEAELFAIDYILHELYPNGNYSDERENERLKSRFADEKDREERQKIAQEYQAHCRFKTQEGREGAAKTLIKAVERKIKKASQSQHEEDNLDAKVRMACSGIIQVLTEREDWFEMLSNLEKNTDKLEEEAKKTFEETENDDTTKRSFYRLKVNIGFINRHIAAVVMKILADADKTYFGGCTANHEEAGKVARYVLRGSSVAGHPVIQAKEEILLGREDYRKAKEEKGQRGKAAKLVTAAKKLKVTGHMDDIELKTYMLLHDEVDIVSSYEAKKELGKFLESYCRAKEPQLAAEFSEAKGIFDAHKQGEIKGPLIEEPKIVEFVLGTAGNDLLLYRVLATYAEKMNSFTSAIQVCSAATDKFKGDDWFVYAYARNVTELQANHPLRLECLEDAGDKLFALEDKAGEMEKADWERAAGDFVFETATKADDFTRAAVLYKGESKRLKTANKPPSPISVSSEKEGETAEACAEAAREIEETLDKKIYATGGEDEKPTIKEYQQDWEWIGENYQYLEGQDQIGQNHPYIQKMTTTRLGIWLKDFSQRMQDKIWRAEAKWQALSEEIADLQVRLPHAETKEEAAKMRRRINGYIQARAGEIEMYHFYNATFDPIERSFYAVFGGENRFLEILDRIGDQNDGD